MCSDAACLEFGLPKVVVVVFFACIADSFVAFSLLFVIILDYYGRFINERIESLVLSITSKTDKGVAPSAQAASQTKLSSRTSSDNFSVFLDPSNKGVELVQLKNNHSEIISDEPMTNISNGTPLSNGSQSSHRVIPVNHELHPTKSNPLSNGSQSSNPSGSLRSDSQFSEGKNIAAKRPVGKWGKILDIISQRKTQVLAPEHLENMWTKGRNYKKKEGKNESVKQTAWNSQLGSNHTIDHLKVSHHMDPHLVGSSYTHIDGNISGQNLVKSFQEKAEHDPMHSEENELQSDSSCTSEDEETNDVTLDSPVTKVWDGKNNRKTAVSHIRHPLENSEGNQSRSDKNNFLGRRRSRPSRQKVSMWQEVQRRTLLLKDGQEILKASKCDTNAEESSDGTDLENLGRVHSGAATSSSIPSISTSNACNSSVKTNQNSVLGGSFLKLRCEVSF